MANVSGRTNDIVADIAKLASRVDGLETSASNVLSVAKIVKVYPGINLRLTVTTFKQEGLFPSTSVLPSAGLYSGGSTVTTGGV